MKWWQGLILGVVMVLAILASYYIGQECGLKKAQNAPIVQTDTLFIQDTITLSKPIYCERVKLDSILVPVVDTLRETDTLYVYLDREQVIWADSLCRVYASGIRPQVDSVTHFITERVIVQDRLLPQSHWGIGVSIGPAVGYFITPAGWQVGAGLSAQVGVVYKF